ncbi:serine/threonine kinase [Methanosarcina siciliae HI350]|uniref:Serine/threonine kinase n=1 Tax=Methanosarcina siciliae HI350 TaxID=1434119 RepID=A0A0E3PAM8_9EURY|nr:formylglycine-generating enzyme family protein [Methanosarcina siciliae]AKB31227.1 serine/threonine kinase [Methanosarcina siciliae HI350]
MGSRISLKNHINTVLSHLKREEIEDSYVVTDSHVVENSYLIEDSYAVVKPGNSITPETSVSSSTGMEFVLVLPGEFYMGSPSEEQGRSDSESPAHKVTIKTSFYMGKFQVTQKQWKNIMGNSPSHFRGEALPVEMVSWNDVQEFVEKLNAAENTYKYRLPSEAEWEYASRAGTQTRYSFGDDESKLKEYAWYVKNSGRKTHPIGRKQSNPWGLYDMHGNVWEWVQDNWHENYNDSLSDGKAWEDLDNSLRVSRGGSWYCIAESCRSAGRFGREHDSHFANLGFRLVKEL